MMSSRPNGYSIADYNNERLQAAARYGLDPSLSHMGLHNPVLNGRLADLQRLQTQVTARQQPSASQPQAPPSSRYEEDHDIGDGLEENCFALVSTEALEKQGLRPHPDKIAEAAALSSVPLPNGTYKMCLPMQVIQGLSHCLAKLCPR